MSNIYIDFYGRYHHKPVTASNPIPGHNGFIYTAYAKKLGLPVDMQKVRDCFSWCTANKDFKFISRSPGQKEPPMSRDEVLGAAALGLLSQLNLDGWSFSPYEIPKFNLLTFGKHLSQVFYIGKNVPIVKEVPSPSKFLGLYFGMRHRNYSWQNNLNQLYRFSFSVPLSDRHFILKQWGKFCWYKPIHVFYATFAKLDSMLGKESGIRWLKYGKSKKAMAQEFPEDHPIFIEANK